ncbi:MAG: DNA polymerase IV [Armatimonadetes bacterium]|nr:DNA polymerase IV [Armatimonadota bacterium]
MKHRTILLIDMNAFFASVEQGCNPSLRGKPVLVGGAPGTRSVVAAASYEARPYGIRSAMSMIEAVMRCPDAIIVEGNSEKYVDTSRRITRIFMDYTDMVEVYSIDECFLDITNTMDIFGGARETARAIKRRIRAELGLTCSVGIGPNKLLAKLAAGMQKPDGLVEIRPEEVRKLLEDLPVEELHGIGGKTKVSLERLGITTAGQLGRTPREMLKRRFGVNGEILHDMGNGIDRSSIVPYYSQPDAKSVGHSYTLSRNTRDWNVISSHLLRLSEMVGRRLREHRYAGRTVTLVLRYGDMHGFCRQKSVSDHLDDGYAIYQVARAILHQQYQRDRRPIRLVGVSVSSLSRGMRQGSLFADPRRRELLKTMDAINDRYGEGAIRRACLLDIRARQKTHGFLR